MKALVLGSGLLGVGSAYYLSQLGHEVTVIDRQAYGAAETSFANGGQISVSHAEPWANPSAPLKALKWLFKDDAPLLFRPRADLKQILWTLRFLRECSPARARRNIEQIVRLGTYSRDALQELRAKTGIEYDHKSKGILHFYTSQKEFDSSFKATEQMRQLGCDRRVVSPDEAVKIEPALSHIRHQLRGATYTAADESGDARKFTLELKKLCEKNGVKFLMNHCVMALREAGGQIELVEATDSEGQFQTFAADAYVLALGSFSAALAAPLGIKLPIYPAKGYSVTMPIKDQDRAYQVSLTDDEYKLVFSRLGDRLRIAGTAELNGYSRHLNMTRCQAIVKRTQELFPDAGDVSNASFWTGLRPATPSNVPIIGRSKLPNLYLNTGHGTLGWTHACGSGKALARLMSGLKAEIEFDFMEESSVLTRPLALDFVKGPA